MSTKIGTASDYVDLLAQLDDYLTATGHAWGKKFTGTGTGDLTAYLGTASSVAETFTITATSATNFTVVGSVSGSLAAATVGTAYTSAKIAFTITAGGTAYVAGDVWTINTAPPWTRLRRLGCADTRKWTTNLANPRFLIDGSLSTNATAATTTSNVDFEMVAPTKVRRLSLSANSTTGTTMPTSISLQWKDNPGDSWTTAQTFTKGSWAVSEGATFSTTSDPGSHKYWRVDMSGATGSTAINELYLYRDLTSGSSAVVVNNHAEWTWQAPGLDGSRAIIASAITAHDEPADTWNVGVGMSRTWLDSEGIATQPGPSGFSGIPLGTSPIGYWFIVNGQRAIVVAKFAAIYQIGYLGFGFPYEPPSVHAYPAIVAGSWKDATLRYSSTSQEFRFPIDPSRGTMRAYYPDSAWRTHSNKFNGGGGGTEGASDTDTTTSPGKVWPSYFHASADQLNFIRDNIDGSRPLVPCVLNCENPVHTWGEFDGLYWATGYSTAPEAVIRQDAFDHLVVPNCFRTTQKDFGAVRLD